MAQHLGYRGADLLGEKRFTNILTLSQGFGFDTDSEYLAGMSSAAIALNMSLISHHYRPDECANVLKPEYQPIALTARHVDGIVLIHRWPLEIAQALRQRYPIASIIHDYGDADIDLIAVDDRGGMDQIVGHLVATGCKRIGFFGLCPEITWSRSRFAGYVDATIHHGRELRMKDVVEISLSDALSEREFARGVSISKALELTKSGIDAWVCPSEMIAHTLVEFLQQAGYPIPEKVSVTGFHASQSQSLSKRTVTSTEAPSAELGAAALRRLVHRIEGSDASRRIILLPARLKVGDTTRAVG